MKVIGLGAPDSVRIRFQACEIDVLVDVLRDQRGRATVAAASTYRRVGREDTRSVDDRHDELRAIEALFAQLENQDPDDRGRVVLVGDTDVMRDVLQDGVRLALERLDDAHERYGERSCVAASSALMDAAETARAWALTLTGFDRVDLGPDE